MDNSKNPIAFYRVHAFCWGQDYTLYFVRISTKYTWIKKYVSSFLSTIKKYNNVRIAQNFALIAHQREIKSVTLIEGIVALYLYLIHQ